MSSKFIALPVGRGDSFFLKRPGHTVLFDGGQAQSLSSLISKHTRCSKLEVVICSHNDADHAKGLIGLLEDPTISISEIWLPGRWLEGIHRIANEPEKFFDEIFHDAFSKDSNESLEDLSVELAGTDTESSVEEIALDRTVAEELEEIEERLPCIYARQLHPLHLVLPFPRLLLEAVEASDRIIRIATLARQRGCKIRWFDFKEFESGKKASGGETWLRPLNSVEVTYRPRQHTPSALQFLALTVSNKESLTFVSNQKGEPSVVFSADSDLEGVTLPSLTNPIATVPHHGSESNKCVYTMNALKNATWVRSDMNALKRPCPDFICLKQPKYCTRCRHAVRPEQCVVFSSNHGSWQPTAATSACSCK